MRRATFGLTILFMLASFPAFAAPKIVFDSEVHEFEEVESGTEIPAEFVFRNEGDEPIEITDLKVTCDCTEARVEPKRLGPGEKGSIFVALDTAYRVGDLDKEVIVRTNDPNRGEITLHIKGKTFLPLTFKPSPMFFPFMASGRESAADVTLMNTGKKPVTINRIVASEADLRFEISGMGNADVSLPHKLEVGQYIWIRLTLKPGEDAKGSINRQLSVVAEPNPVTPLVLKIQGTLPQ